MWQGIGDKIYLNEMGPLTQLHWGPKNHTFEPWNHSL